MFDGIVEQSLAKISRYELARLGRIKRRRSFRFNVRVCGSVLMKVVCDLGPNSAILIVHSSVYFSLWETTVPRAQQKLRPE